MSDPSVHKPIEPTAEMKTGGEAADHAKGGQYARTEDGAVDPGSGTGDGALPGTAPLGAPADAGATNRGKPAVVAPDGSVLGSGAGAGGGGTAEDYDSDSASGAGGDIEPRRPRPEGSGGDASQHGST